ncbi:MAG: hydrolase, alpha/beta fold family protein [Actinomycetia bacterium]|nr:hydrolase, alpha/beta fold family protein [Actinomycetes bacterium]
MATYVLLPGAGSDSWYWHLVTPRLEALGHDVVAVDLPTEDESAGLPQYADVVIDAIGGRGDLVVVAQSLGGFTAPIVCDRVPVDLLVLVAAMTPAPGESPSEWWDATGHVDPQLEVEDMFFHDVPADVTAAAFARPPIGQSQASWVSAFPLAAWPDVPTRFLLMKDDRLFPADFQRRVVQERLGITPDEMDGGHLPALAHPDELVARLERYRADVTG